MVCMRDHRHIDECPRALSSLFPFCLAMFFFPVFFTVCCFSKLFVGFAQLSSTSELTQKERKKTASQFVLVTNWNECLGFCIYILYINECILEQTWVSVVVVVSIEMLRAVVFVRRNWIYSDDYFIGFDKRTKQKKTHKELFFSTTLCVCFWRLLLQTAANTFCSLVSALSSGHKRAKQKKSPNKYKLAREKKY